MMRIDYDKEANAAYIYLEEKIGDGEVSKTITLKTNVNVDLDASGKWLGIEILNADKILSKNILKH